MKLCLRLSDMCPCASGEVFRECCFRPGGTVFTAPCQTIPPEKSPVYSNPACYASELANCSQNIEGEHYISKGVLVDLASPGPLTVRGFPWQESGVQQQLFPNALTANILCSSHNRALSCLDNVGKRLVAGLSSVDEFFRSTIRGAPQKLYFFNGTDIERWFLKVLCGIVSSGNAAFKDRRIDPSKPPLAWLQLLFGLEPFPSGWGLYLRSGVGEGIMAQKEFSFAPLVPAGRSVVGCVATIHGIKLLLAMAEPIEGDRGDLVVNSIYRPTYLQFVDSETENEAGFVFGWDNKGDDKGIVISFKRDG